MSFTPDGTNSPLYTGSQEGGPFPSNGEVFDGDAGAQHLKKLTEAVDAIIRRLGLTADADGVAWSGFNTVAERFNNLPGASTDHGALTGLGDDDHTQYHNDARGDARYYTQTQLNTGQLDSRYFAETEHVDTSTGVPDAGKPIKLTAGGIVNSNMLGTRTSELFFPVQTDGNTGDYRRNRVGANGSYQFTFAVPDDFDSVQNILLIGIPNGAVSGTADLSSSYGNRGSGQSATNHQETNLGVSWVGTSGNLTEFSLLSVFSVLDNRDMCGITVDHNSLGAAIDYLGIILRYNARIGFPA